MSKRFSVLTALLLMVCLLAGVGASAQTIEPYGETPDAYVGADGKVWLADGDAPLSDTEASAIVYLDDGAVYFLAPVEDGAPQLIMQPRDGGAPSVIASEAYGDVFALDGKLYFEAAEDGAFELDTATGELTAIDIEAYAAARTLFLELASEPETTDDPAFTDPIEEPEPEATVEPELIEEPETTASPTASPVPEKTPGPSGYVGLVRGDRGAQVTRLQKRLIELGYLKAGTADGQFGKNTEQAIKNFQAALKLKQSGSASVDLQKKLFAKSAPKYQSSGYVKLERGDSGEHVKKLQKRLKNLGYYNGTVNGKFNADTENAVKLFQKALGVKQSGVATADLQKKLFAKSAPAYSTEEYVKLKRGSTGERVKKLQRRLKKLGYFTGEIGGNYLNLTEKAVKRFQKKIGEDATGVATVALQKKIFDDSAPYYK